MVWTVSARVFGRIGPSLAIHVPQQELLLLRRGGAEWEISTQQSDGVVHRRYPDNAHQIQYVQPLGFAANWVHDPKSLQFKRQQILRRRNRNHEPCRRTIARKSPKLKMVRGTASKRAEVKCHSVVEPVLLPMVLVGEFLHN